jgi:hypothetical protein
MFRTFFSKIFSRECKLVHYRTIDTLPIYNWMKIHETGDLEFLLIVRQKMSKWDVKYMEKTWKKLYHEYIERFGYSDTFVEQMIKRREIAMMKIRMMVNEDRSVKTMIRIAEVELQEMESDGNMDFFTGKSLLEKSLGFHIDIHKISVAEYYSHFQLVNKENKDAKSRKVQDPDQ